MAECKKKEEKLHKSIQMKKMKEVIFKWRERSQKTKNLRMKYQLIHHNYCKGLLLKSIEGFKDHNLIQKTFIKTL